MQAKPDLTQTVATGAASGSSSVPRLSSSSGVDEGRFVPGTLLAGRYRIIGLLGRGGMGEVYRATDLTLGQSVALKFLPGTTAQDQRTLERFHNEVRVARQVSHPNVCRVYDIGEADGMPFLSMEYVDGEDLATLLQRIGRLPADKALETARKICAGLAAAHDKGVIHRDLKPQNVMMNRRGEVLIMDFGLAAVAESIGGPEAKSGTPAYMSPEQLKGGEVTLRSDIYALGLMLYELFTGKRPYEAKDLQELIEKQEGAQLTSMSSIAADIDPAVEQVIRRCLDPDAARRPATALAVSAALPGGDPLAAALAAGETPSPEMVAAAGSTSCMPLRWAVACLAFVGAVTLGMPPLQQRINSLMSSPVEYPPDVMRQKARDLAVLFGYPQKPGDWHFEFVNRGFLRDYLAKLPGRKDWRELYGAESPYLFSYREALEPLDAGGYGTVDTERPAPIQPGMVKADLHSGGPLRGFQAVPYKQHTQALEPAVSPEVVFRALDFRLEQFTPVPYQGVPNAVTDTLLGWKGPHPRLPNTEVQVHVGWWKGRVTSVRLAWPWTSTIEQVRAEAAWPEQLLTIFRILATMVALLAVFIIARRNLKAGRADRRGAVVVGVSSMVLIVLAWFGRLHMVLKPSMFGYTINNLEEAAMAGVFLAFLYLALEPAVRARWPQSIVMWNRLLRGQWLDPGVGTHILIGCSLGALIAFTLPLRVLLTSEAEGLSGSNLNAMAGFRAWVGASATIGMSALQVSLVVFFAIFGLRQILRRDYWAAIAGAVVFAFLVGEGDPSSRFFLVDKAVMTLVFAALIFALLRLGLVATMAAVLTVNSLAQASVGLDLSAWFAPYAVARLLVPMALAVFAYWRATSAPPLETAGHRSRAVT
jgi:serine/threonine-protein kinase